MRLPDDSKIISQVVPGSWVWRSTAIVRIHFSYRSWRAVKIELAQRRKDSHELGLKKTENAQVAAAGPNGNVFVANVARTPLAARNGPLRRGLPGEAAPRAGDVPRPTPGVPPPPPVARPERQTQAPSPSSGANRHARLAGSCARNRVRLSLV